MGTTTRRQQKPQSKEIGERQAMHDKLEGDQLWLLTCPMAPVLPIAHLLYYFTTSMVANSNLFS